MNTSWHHIWKAIHVIGKTFDSSNEFARESFVCFFDCLQDLLPDISARNTLSSFMQQNPVERSISTNKDAFEWTFSLHSFVNYTKQKQGQLSDNITKEQAYTKYSNITKSDWSHPTWFLMHYIAANLPLNVSYQQRTSFKAFIVSLRYLLPCPECRHHMSEYITSTEIDPYLSHGKDVFQWTWTFHNAVNARLGTPTISFQEAIKMYQNTTNNMYTLIDF